jgi:biofilm PGA synthesis N-glycosyltransferase PgaC
MSNPTYVLVTPVRNEEATIGITLESVVRQTLLPLQWIVVSDGSTDRTDEIIESYARQHSFIRLLRLKDRPNRSFSSVVFATEAGIEALTVDDYQYIGLLDADIRFSPTYYADIFARFKADPTLGLAGGLVVDLINGERKPNLQTTGDVAGAVQLFRRECFDRLGGLTAIPEGGWDAITCLAARMHGYSVRTFRDVEVDHLKPRNASEGHLFQRISKLGERDYALGNHPLFEFCKCIYRCLERPYIVAGLLRLSAFVRCHIARRPRYLSAALIQRTQQEQLRRVFLLPPLKAGIKIS